VNSFFIIPDTLQLFSRVQKRGGDALFNNEVAKYKQIKFGMFVSAAL